MMAATMAEKKVARSVGQLAVSWADMKALTMVALMVDYLADKKAFLLDTKWDSKRVSKREIQMDARLVHLSEKRWETPKVDKLAGYLGQMMAEKLVALSEYCLAAL